MSESSDQLPHSPLIDPLPPESRMRLTMHGEFQFCEPGETLIEQGKHHGSLFYIMNGELEARRTDDENTIVLGKIPVRRVDGRGGFDRSSQPGLFGRGYETHAILGDESRGV